MEEKFGTSQPDIVRDEHGDIIISTAAAYLSGVKAAVTFKSDDVFYQDKDTKPVQVTIGEKTINMVPWGDKNVYPKEVVSLIEPNVIAMSLIEFKTDLGYGGGVKLGHYVNGELVEYTPDEIDADTKLAEVQQWFDDNAVNSELAEGIMDVVWWNAADVELRLNKELNLIASIGFKDKIFGRWSAMNSDGKIEYHLYSAKWEEGANEDNTVVTNVLDFKKPGLELKTAMGLRFNEEGEKVNTAKRRYIYPISYASQGRKYYPFPSWQAIIKSGWIEFANAIPIFKKSLMVNSITVKYHVEISDSYFPRIFVELGLKTAKERKERRDKEYADIQSFLTSAENTGKPWISYYKVTPEGRAEIHDIKITKIDSKVGGEYLEDSQEASAMTYNAFGVHPNLHGVIPSRNTSNLSGSDKRELLRIAQTLQVRKRQKFLELFKLIKEINNWPKGLVLYIQDVILTTLDQGKEVQNINTPAQ